VQGDGDQLYFVELLFFMDDCKAPLQVSP